MYAILTKQIQRNEPLEAMKAALLGQIKDIENKTFNIPSFHDTIHPIYVDNQRNQMAVYVCNGNVHIKRVCSRGIVATLKDEYQYISPIVKLYAVMSTTQPEHIENWCMSPANGFHFYSRVNFFLQEMCLGTRERGKATTREALVKYGQELLKDLEILNCDSIGQIFMSDGQQRGMVKRFRNLRALCHRRRGYTSWRRSQHDRQNATVIDWLRHLGVCKPNVTGIPEAR